MNDTIIIDMDVLIDFSRGEVMAADFLRRHATSAILSVSVVTKMELLVGCRNKAEIRTQARFLKRFYTVKIDPPTCDRAVALLERYRLSHGLLMPDALVAATALVHGLPLVTKNWKDYRFIRGLVLPSYP